MHSSSAQCERQACCARHAAWRLCADRLGAPSHWAVLAWRAAAGRRSLSCPASTRRAVPRGHKACVCVFGLQTRSRRRTKQRAGPVGLGAARQRAVALAAVGNNSVGGRLLIKRTAINLAGGSYGGH